MKNKQNNVNYNMAVMLGCNMVSSLCPVVRFSVYLEIYLLS